MVGRYYAVNTTTYALCLLRLRFCLVVFAEINLSLEKFLGRDNRGFGKFLVILGNLDLFAILESLLQRVVHAREIGQFAVQLLLDLAGDLARLEMTTTDS